MCFLSFAREPGKRPSVTTSHGKRSPVRATEVMPILQRARGYTEPQVLQFDDAPALLVPLIAEGRLVGSALLTFTDGSAVNLSQVAAAAAMAAAALDAGRRIAALHMQAEEIEERVRLREIQASRNLLRGVIDSIPLGLALLDPDGIVRAANRSLSDRFGLDPAVLVGMPYAAVVGRWENSPAARTFANGQVERDRRSMVHPDGATALLEITSFPLIDADGQPHQVVEVWEDITQRVALQTQLVRAEKLAAIGQLAASIAHEVGNPLQAIQGFLSLFLEQCAPETPNRRYLELAEEEIERIVQVISRLRDLYRPKTDVVASVDINNLIEQILLLTGKQLERAHIRVVRELDPELPYVQGVAHLLKQVLLNLVLNALEAMPMGGMLSIRTAQHTASTKRRVTIDIADTGIGIPSDRIALIFDGLHTSKEHGMGLGLYTSKSIVDQHMGRVDVQSAVGQGTTFTLTLPVDYQEDLQ